MNRGGKVVAFVLSLVAVFVVLHSVYHVFVFGTGISGFAQAGISGIVIGDKDFREEIQIISSGVFNKSFSKIILFVEWGLLFALLVFAFVRKRITSKRELESLHIRKNSSKSKGPSTDLDSLYDILKDKKHLKLSTISKVYGIDKEVAMLWGKTLESGKLIRVDYPFFSEPRFVYTEKEVPKVNEKEKAS